jgi:hypothetical protein
MGMFFRLLDAEDEGSTLLQNAGNYNQTVSKPAGLESSATPV